MMFTHLITYSHPIVVSHWGWFMAFCLRHLERGSLRRVRHPDWRTPTQGGDQLNILQLGLDVIGQLFLSMSLSTCFLKHHCDIADATAFLLLHLGETCKHQHASGCTSRPVQRAALQFARVRTWPRAIAVHGLVKWHMACRIHISYTIRGHDTDMYYMY